MNRDLLSSLTESIGLVTLNRPEFRNALTLEMWKELPATFESLKKEGAKIIILTGHGDCFGSGADLHDLKEIKDLESARELWHAIRDTLEFVYHFSLPTIAMIPGACIGGACLLATACDLRYASFNATFAVPIARFGIYLDDHTISRMVALIGPAHAKEMLLTGNTISGAQAERFGLINLAVGQNELSIHVDELARRIVNNVDAAVSQCKTAVNRIATGVPIDLQINDDEIVHSYLNPEFRDRVARRK